MNIEIDYSPTPSKSYFISVSLNDKEAISFDYTTKAKRITKQVLIEKRSLPGDKEISGEWDALVFENFKFIKRYHVRWIDIGRKDWVNDEIWETVSERPVSEELKDKLLKYSQLISDTYKQPDLLEDELKKLEGLLKPEIDKFQR